MKRLLLIALAIVPVSAIFFGGGGGGGCGGCQQSCCSAPAPCAPPPPPCPPPPPPPSPCGCGGGFGGGYQSAPVQTCRPRYIIVRSVSSGFEGGQGGYSGGGGYASSSGGYVSAPQSYSAPAPVASYQPAPQSYSAPQPVFQQPAPQSYSVPQAAPQPSYQQPAPAPAPIPVAQPSYASGGQSYAHASKTLIPGSKCTSKELRVILENSIVPGDANESKRRIHATATEQFRDANGEKATIDVICAQSDLSFRIATSFFCEHKKEDVTCFVFQHS